MRSGFSITRPCAAIERPRRAVWLLALLPALAAAQAPAREQVTLDEAIARALRHDPRTVRARGQTEISAAQERTAMGAYLPSVSADASTGTSRGVVAGDTPVSAGVSASWSVFTGFRRSARRAQAQAETEAARAQLLQSGANVALDVEATFYDALRAQELETVARAQLQRAQEGAEAAKRRAKAGTGTRSDELRSELELHTARRALLEAQTARDTAAYALGRWIGTDGPVDPRPDGVASGAEPVDEPASVVTEILQRSPEVRVAEAELRSAQAGRTVARSSYFPQVTASGGYDWGSRYGALVPGDTGWTARLGLSLPLFDGFQREESVERARVTETVAAATLADTRRAVRASAEQLLGQVRLARERIALAEQSVAVAAEDLRMQQERYRLGVSTMLELLSSQEALADAERGRVDARFDYRLARAELQALAGRHRE